MPTSDSDFSCVAEVDGTVAAMGFLDIVDGMGQPGMPKATEGLIGYIVHPDLPGKGVASDLARGLLAAAFGHLGLRRVTASCNADNAASVRVLEKAGMLVPPAEDGRRPARHRPEGHRLEVADLPRLEA
ncbi:MAG: GNAT family N-acetyltransferase [Nocardioidaceae bacterium]